MGIEYFEEPNEKLFEHCFDYPKPDFDANDQLIFTFLYHLTYYEKSVFKQYLTLLPSRILLGFLQFSDEEIALLSEDESLIHHIQKNREELYKRYYKMKEIYESTYTTEQRISLLGHPTISMGDYVWAWSYLRTHTWKKPNKERVLLPIADLVNCQPIRNTTSLGFVTGTPEGTSIAWTDRSFKAGNQILWNYAKSSSEGYLVHYGFVPQNNEYDYLEIPFLNQEFILQYSDSRLNISNIFEVSKLQNLRIGIDQLSMLANFNRFVNMNQEERIQCETVLSDKNLIEKPYDVFVKKCPQAKGEFSVFPRILAYIEAQVKVFKSVYAKIDEYRLEATKDRFDWLNTLLSYYRDRLLVIRKLSKSILDFEKSQS
eukprot:TRINITY_DN3027_c0_g1_i1.p1 TRINITY_DN3027_c0_g1~~TRINITY_DN3027_c0_g1_i1.p1  ORF type:complete len:372 (-),score=43.53 TRINITY_DN3027_c0_g1_i1:98-1213(-)